MRFLSAFLLSFFTLSLSAQLTQNDSFDGKEVRLNTITTAVPFLLIAPDSRSGAMGDAGVAISPDANAVHWNASKLAFADDDSEISLAYSPWLRALVPDMNMAYLSGYQRMNSNLTMGASLRYFTLGDITFTDEQGNAIRNFKPNEFAIDAAVATRLSDRFSGGLAVRFVYSNLTGGTDVNGASSKAGSSVAADVSAYYVNDDVTVGGKDAILTAGLNISNIGAKMAYSESGQRDFIPINMRLGPALTLNLDDYNQITFTTDFNKLLVPTPPIYDPTSSNEEIIAGRDPNVGVASGIFGSFSDAPGEPVTDENGDFVYNEDGTLQIQDGSAFREELREINISAGMEYWYAQQFAVRAGYFHEHASKGNRKYFTVGFGFKYNVFQIDGAYLIATQQRNPLANTLRFTLRFAFDASGGSSSATPDEG